MIHENNVQQAELQLYINNIIRDIDIVYIISAMIQDHQYYTLVKCVTIFYKSIIYKLQLHSMRLCSSIKS